MKTPLLSLTAVTILTVLVTLFSCNNNNQIEEKPNIIFMIGDGMGLAQITASYLRELNNNRNLSMLTLPYSGLVSTHSLSDTITDSGAAGTALATGFKTKNGFIGIDSTGKINLENLTEKAIKNGYLTGVISTSGVTHATPAAFLSHNISRNSYEEIALDISKSRANIIIGGGRDHFNKRKDSTDLLTTMKKEGYTISSSLDSINPKNLYNISLLANDHLPQALENKDVLAKSTKLALNLLSQLTESSTKKPFFIMIEGSQIDWGGHDNDIERVINETLSFDNAVAEALQFIETHPNTLLIVTADHETGGLSIIHKEKDSNGNKISGTEFNFSSTGHSASFVPIFTKGSFAELFTGFMDNTVVSKKITTIIEK